MTLGTIKVSDVDRERCESQGARRRPELPAELADGIGAMIVGGRHAQVIT